MHEAEIYKFPDASEREIREKQGVQVEHGFTRIANELYEVLNNRHSCPINVRHLCLVHAVIRRTYGFNKTMDDYADTQMAADTGIPRQKINPVKHELLAMKILRLSEDGRKIGVNKSYAEWDFSARPERKPPQAKRRQDGDSVTEMVTKSVTKEGTHKRQKDNSVPKGTEDTSKKNSPRKWGDEIDHTLTDEMVTAVSADLDAPVKHNPATWANTFRLMRERDQRTVEQIRFLIAWTAKHRFWSGVILSPANLRDKWDQLAKQVKSEKRPASGRHTGLQAPSKDGLIDKGDGTYEF